MAKIYLSVHPAFMDLKVETGHHICRHFGQKQNDSKEKPMIKVFLFI